MKIIHFYSFVDNLLTIHVHYSCSTTKKMSLPPALPLLPAGGSLNSMLLSTTQEDTFKINDTPVGHMGKERDFEKAVALPLILIQ